MYRHKSLVIAAGLTLVALSLSACNSGGVGGDESSVEPDSITFVAFGGISQDVLRDQWLDPWGKANGVTVVQDSPTDYAKLVATAEAGRPAWDLVDSESFFPIQECGTLLQKLDLTGVDLSKLPEGTVSDCAVPLYGYSIILVYNPAKYPQPPTSFADFFDLEKFPGNRLAPGNAPSGPLEVALLADGVEGDDLYPLDIDRALEKWEELRGNIEFWSTGAESQQALESGSADMAVVWSGRAADATINGANIEPVWNQNLYGWASLSIPIGVAAPGHALSAIKDVLTPETQERIAENIAYSPINSDAKPNLRPEFKKYNVASPEIANQRVVQNAEWWAKNQKEAVMAWSTWTLG